MSSPGRRSGRARFLWLSAALVLALGAAAALYHSDGPGERMKIRRELRKF
ncbi:MAG: hypothetical protein VKJ66_03805 [Synechococcus sp.]|nr:hypothetical protein [Synechococcus sp.]